MRNLQDELIAISGRVEALIGWLSENHDLTVDESKFSPRQMETLRKLMARPGYSVNLLRPDVELLREHWGAPCVVETRRDFYKIDMDDLADFLRRVSGAELPS